MSGLERLLHDRMNHVFSVELDMGEGMTIPAIRSKAQLLREPYVPGTKDVVLSHLAGCACKPLPKYRRSNA